MSVPATRPKTSNTGRQRQPDVIVVSISFAALWAIALGIWVLTPSLIAIHRLYALNALQWVTITAGVTLLFAVVGVFLGFFGGLVLMIIETVCRRPFRNRACAYGLFMGPLVVLGYLGESVLIHHMAFRTITIGSVYGKEPQGVVALVAGASILLALIYWRVVIPRNLKPSGLAWFLAGTIGVGYVAMVPSMLQRPIPAPKVTLARSGIAPTAPVLFIGLDGATWRVLQPAMDAGSAPTIRRLVESGMRGSTDALWPPYWSSAAWASIVTGLPRQTTGVYQDLAAVGPGLPWFQVALLPSIALNPMFALRAFLRSAGAIRFTPPPRQILNGEPVWQLMHDDGVDTAVVRFRFTYPPDGQGDTVISDWAGHDEWDGLGVEHDMGPDTVAPRSRADELLAPFRKTGPWNPGLFASLLPGPVPAQPADALGDPIEALRTASDIDERTFEAADSVLRRNARQQFLAVYIGGLDSVEHAYWQYRFPGDFQTNLPAPEDVRRLGPVVDRYVRYVDQRLNRLLSLYAVRPNVVIVSDHGHGATTVATNWRGWHTKEGVFISAGPSIPHHSEAMGSVSYYDIVPTLLSLEGLRVCSGLQGHPLVPVPGDSESANGCVPPGRPSTAASNR